MVKRLIRAVANSCTTEECFKIPALFNNNVKRRCGKREKKKKKKAWHGRDIPSVPLKSLKNLWIGKYY